MGGFSLKSEWHQTLLRPLGFFWLSKLISTVLWSGRSRFFIIIIITMYQKYCHPLLQSLFNTYTKDYLWLHYLLILEFANSPGNRGSIPGRVIPKTQKMVLDASFLNTLHYKVRIKDKWGNPRKGVAPSPPLQCSSYWKGAFGSLSTTVGQLIYNLYTTKFSLLCIDTMLYHLYL